MMNASTHIKTLLHHTPECEEVLFPFLEMIDDECTVATLALKADVDPNCLLIGLERQVKRAQQSPCDREKMKALLIKKGSVNVAGFVSFLWEQNFISCLENMAATAEIKLNLVIFPKHKKKYFQNYLATCTSEEDLPDILIGKGFSSFMTQRFVRTFLRPGFFTQTKIKENISPLFKTAGLEDKSGQYHPFGIEEMIILRDETLPLNGSEPLTWPDLLRPEYRHSIMQMGKDQRDHFGFNIMLYLYTKGGKKYVEDFAKNVKNKQHFSFIIKNIGQKTEGALPLNIVHQFAHRLVRSEAREHCHLVQTSDGNPAMCHFLLVKSNASKAVLHIADLFYSKEIKQVMEQGGTTHISSSISLTGSQKVQWIDWRTIKELPLPYLKEQLSEWAFNHYNTNTLCHNF